MRFEYAIGHFVIPLVLALQTHGVLTFAGAQEEHQQTQPASAGPMLSQDELDQQFEELLSNSQLVGYFTESGKEGDAPLQADKYTIASVKKQKGDYWLFEARIQYNNQDTTMRLPLEVKWAGDTPVITLTKVFVPGMGTFSARVLFYGNEYAGTWSAGDHGGHMFGRVERLDADAGEPAASN